MESRAVIRESGVVPGISPEAFDLRKKIGRRRSGDFPVSRMKLDAGSLIIPGSPGAYQSLVVALTIRQILFSKSK